MEFLQKECGITTQELDNFTHLHEVRKQDILITLAYEGKTVQKHLNGIRYMLFNLLVALDPLWTSINIK